jgi:RNA polymerase sigma-70 factor (ECF subfamily)
MNLRSDRDESLMAEVATGQRTALEPLIRRHASPLLSYVQRMVGDRHRGEEIFQEVFLAVWSKRGQYQFPRPFKPWLYGIATNKCYEVLRARQGFRGVEPAAVEQLISPEPAPDDRAVATETAALVERAVQCLPAQQRAVVVLRLWQGLSYAEIAGVVGRTEATVRSHMSHGLAGLRQYLEPRL